MGILDTLRNALKADASAQVEAALEKARQEEADASAALGALLSRRSAALVAGDDALRRFKADHAAADERLERAMAFVAALEAQLADVREREAESAAAARYRQAKKLSDAAGAKLAEVYPRAARELAELIKLCAEADQAVHEANAALPVGKAPLIGPEALLRDRPGEEARVLKRRRVKRWCYESTGHLIPEERERELTNVSGDKGALQPIGLSRQTTSVIRRAFEEQTVLPARRRERGPRLAEIFLPGMRAGDPPIWSPGRSTDYPDGILARISELAVLKPQPRPEEQAETILVPLPEPEEGDAPAEEAA